MPKESQEAQFQLVLLARHQETALRGCHNEVSDLGLKRMLSLMCDHFFGLKWLCSKGTCQEVLPVHHLQSKATAGSHGKYHGYPFPVTSSH